MRNKTSNNTSDVKQLVTFELEDRIYGMDIMVAQENLRYEGIRPIPNSPSYFEGFKNLRGEIIPIINFKNLFLFKKFDMEKQKYIIRISIDGSNFGVVVDKVLRVVSYRDEDIAGANSEDQEIDNYIKGVIKNKGELISVLDMREIFNYTDKTLMLGKDDDEYMMKHKAHKSVYVNFNKDTIKDVRSVKIVGDSPASSMGQ